MHLPQIAGLFVAALVTFQAGAAFAAAPSEDYELAWADEFSGKELDATKWDYRGLGPRRKAVNDKDCVTLDGEGHLLITTKKVGDAYHTAVIGTQGKFETAFGYFECRVKLQTQQGHWSAFWIQSPTISKVGDPKVNGTEIDVFEYLSNVNEVNHALHWDGYGKEHKSKGKRTKDQDFKFKEGYHTFGVEWTPEEYVFNIDGKEVWRTKDAVSHLKEYIILSMEVDTWGGDIGKAQLPDSCYFDYVRVYKKRDAGNPVKAPADKAP
jgi:beta-glucanase (GH16 family)